jgi:hypothetical protein
MTLEILGLWGLNHIDKVVILDLVGRVLVDRHSIALWWLYVLGSLLDLFLLRLHLYLHQLLYQHLLVDITFLVDFLHDLLFILLQLLKSKFLALVKSLVVSIVFCLFFFFTI